MLLIPRNNFRRTHPHPPGQRWYSVVDPDPTSTCSGLEVIRTAIAIAPTRLYRLGRFSRSNKVKNQNRGKRKLSSATVVVVGPGTLFRTVGRLGELWFSPSAASAGTVFHQVHSPDASVPYGGSTRQQVGAAFPGFAVRSSTSASSSVVVVCTPVNCSSRVLFC